MDNDFPHLSKAPIREAVFDVRVEPGGALAPEALAAFVERVKVDFPAARPIRTVEAAFGMPDGEPGVTSSPPETTGTICWNAATTRAVQARRDGFSVNHVKGYESWPVLREQAQRLWNDYVAVVGPKKVTRCALRYINRLELPVQKDWATYLRTRPEISTELPQSLDELFMRVVVPFGDGRKASISLATEPRLEADAMAHALILDIDAFSTRTFDVGDNAMWTELDELRRIKNECFFGSLKKAAWEVFR